MRRRETQQLAHPLLFQLRLVVGPEHLLRLPPQVELLLALPAVELAFRAVDDGRAREGLGYAARRSIEEAVAALDDVC